MTDQKRKIVLNFVDKDDGPWYPLNLWFDLSGGSSETDPNGRKEITIQPWAITRWSTSPQENGALDFGYMFVDENAEYLKISAFLTYNPSPERKTEVGVFPSREIDQVIFPIDRDTALAIVNPHDHEIQVWIDYAWTTPPGSLSDFNIQWPFTLRARDHASFFLKLFEDENDGWIHVYASSPNDRIAVMALIFRMDGTMSSLLAHEIPPAWREERSESGQ